MPIFCLALRGDCACRVDVIEVSVLITGAGLFRQFLGHGRSQVAFFVFFLNCQRWGVSRMQFMVVAMPFPEKGMHNHIMT